MIKLHMNFEIQYEKEWQIRYYISRLARIVDGFYQRNHHIVLPYKHSHYWYIPDYNLFSDNLFVEELKSISGKYIFAEPSTYLSEKVSGVFDEYVHFDEIEQDLLKIKQFEVAFMNFLKAIFPQLPDIYKVIIIPTKIGTNGTFSKNIDNEGKLSLYVTYRLGYIERLPSTIMGGIIQEFCQFDAHIANEAMQRQYLIDFFQKYTFAGTLLGEINIPSTIDILKDDNHKYVMDAYKYYAKLGFPAKNMFSVLENTILFGEIPLKDLQPVEIELLKLFIAKKNLIVSFDDIAKACWGDVWQDKFSLSYIAKIIERTRKALHQNGILQKCIHTVSKKGYVFYD